MGKYISANGLEVPTRSENKYNNYNKAKNL